MNQEYIQAITLFNPWATLVALWMKQYETRRWSTGHRGPLAIHSAGKGSFHPAYMELPEIKKYAPDLKIEHLVFGAVLAIVEMSDCIEIDPHFAQRISHMELAFGEWQPGRYAWQFDSVKKLREPLIIRGQQGMWKVPATIRALL